MYTDLLSRILERWVDELTGDALIDHARTCRVALGDRGAYGPASSADLLAAEISYDRVLVRLCEIHGIVVDPAAFVHPGDARRCLEAELATAGVDLVDDPGRRPARDPLVERDRPGDQE
jgi:hypothetical protein